MRAILLVGGDAEPAAGVIEAPDKTWMLLFMVHTDSCMKTREPSFNKGPQYRKTYLAYRLL